MITRFAVAALIFTTPPALAEAHLVDWSTVDNGTWVGPETWANRLQDWAVVDGRLTCVETRPLPLRAAALLTHDLEPDAGLVDLTIDLGLAPDQSGPFNPDAMGGVALGVGRGEMDHRAAALIHGLPGPGAGWFVGLDATGEIIVHDLEQPLPDLAPAPAAAVERAAWCVADVDSVEPGREPERAIDGDPSTFWHSEWRRQKPPHPHWITIDLGEATTFDGVAYLPRQGSSSGRVVDYRVLVGDDAAGPFTAVAEGRVDAGDQRVQRIALDRAHTARFLRFEALSAAGGRPVTSIAELYLLNGDVDLAPPPPSSLDARARLRIRTGARRGERIPLVIERLNPENNAVTAREERLVPVDRMRGGISLISHPGRMRDGAARFQFHAVRTAGDGVRHHPDRTLGPILSAQFTLERRGLHLTAQLMPIADPDAEVVLEAFDPRLNRWIDVRRSPVVRPGYTATFHSTSWPASYFEARLVYGDHAYPITLPQDPSFRGEFVLAALSCNHNNSHNLIGGWGASNTRQQGDWLNGLWFPHDDLVERVAACEPDLLFFAGDQLYEGGSPTFADRQHLELDYLYKWYLWCWAYRDLTRRLPCVVIPDDHDVYQGNLWGAGGRKATSQTAGGYVHPAWFVKMVERTQTSHLPPPHDPTPVEQGIGVYYTDLVWGGVSFAILEDRKFKSGCEDPRLPKTTTGRADHFNEPGFDTSRLDLEGLTLLGERQLKFLDEWADDWNGAKMKVALSQTPFANLATNHGKNQQRLIADLDSNGWPQSGRRRALEVIRRANAIHVCGDQHLATLAQHGIDEHRDAIWSFCGPASANFYPRAWRPEAAGANREDGAPEWTGDHVDGFGNLVTVYAATNPVPMGREPKDLHDGMAGWGIVRINTTDRTYTFECWPRFADPRDPTTGGQYSGWPRTIRQDENGGPAR